MICVWEIMLILPNYLTGEDISALAVVMLIHFTTQAVRAVRLIVMRLGQSTRGFSSTVQSLQK